MAACESAHAKGPARAGPSASLHVAYKNLAVQTAEKPDQQNDRQRNADEPKQYPTSHDILLYRLITDCLPTTLRGGSSIAAAGVGRPWGIGPVPRGLSRRGPWLYCARRARRGGRVAEGARLESVYTGNRIVGSNPTPSANSITNALIYHIFFTTFSTCPIACPSRAACNLAARLSLPTMRSASGHVFGDQCGALLAQRSAKRGARETVRRSADRHGGTPAVTEARNRGACRRSQQV
jgi:hypothetical protein